VSLMLGIYKSVSFSSVDLSLLVDIYFNWKNLDTLMYSGFAWLIIMGSGLDDWIYWYDLTITVSYNSSQSKTCCIPYRTTSVCSSTATNHCSHIELPYE
jgi:hypothetical protein